MSALAAFAAVRSSGKSDGRLQVLNENLSRTLNDVARAKQQLLKLEQLKLDLATKITSEAARRTKVLEEDLSEEEVLRRLKEKGLVKK